MFFYRHVMVNIYIYFLSWNLFLKALFILFFPLHISNKCMITFRVHSFLYGRSMSPLACKREVLSGQYLSSTSSISFYKHCQQKWCSLLDCTPSFNRIHVLSCFWIGNLYKFQYMYCIVYSPHVKGKTGQKWIGLEGCLRIIIELKDAHISIIIIYIFLQIHL